MSVIHTGPIDYSISCQKCYRPFEYLTVRSVPMVTIRDKEGKLEKEDSVSISRCIDPN